MARELGPNAKKLGKLNNHRQERWKAPFPDFIASRYLRSGGRSGAAIEVRPDQRSRCSLRAFARGFVSGTSGPRLGVAALPSARDRPDVRYPEMIGITAL